MRTEYVIVEDYNPQWEQEFIKIKKEIESCLGPLALSIEHVGSTSVKGLAAKPIIDLDVVINDQSLLNDVIQRLGSIGYIYEGNLGIEGREAFKYKSKPHLMTHHLYVCPKDSKELYRHITFRNYLRNHPEARKAYSKIKKEAALLFPNSIEQYIEYKSTCINEIYKKCKLL